METYRIDRPWGDNGTMTGGMRGWRPWRVNKASPGIAAGTSNGLHWGTAPRPILGDEATRGDPDPGTMATSAGWTGSASGRATSIRTRTSIPRWSEGFTNHLTYGERILQTDPSDRCGIGLHAGPRGRGSERRHGGVRPDALRTTRRCSSGPAPRRA